MRRFEGIWPALVTPFDPNGEFDPKAMGRLVRFGLDGGASGFYACGSTAESYLLSLAERKCALEAVMEAVNGRVPVIAHIGALATRDSVDLARHADALGVEAVSSVPPFYFKFSRDEYMSYYRAILDGIHAPLLLYNVPAMSGMALSDEDVGFFFREERIIGLKFTSYDLFQLERLIRRYPGHAFFSGHDEIFLPALSAGAQAVIGSTYNFMASKFVKIRERFLCGDMAGARALQGEANALIEALLEAGMIKGVKVALAVLGVDCGACRPPFSELDELQVTKVRAAVERGL